MKWCPVCKHRGELWKLLPPGGVGVEVGVRFGEFADLLLSQWSGTLNLVDPWDSASDDPADRDRPWEDEEDYAAVVRRFVGRKAIIHRQTSLDAARHLPDGLDFVYVDADHSYESVRGDLEAWYPKLAPGGVLAGHDFLYQIHRGVTMAAVEFALMRNLALYVVPGTADSSSPDLGRDGGVCSYYMQKDGYVS